MRKKNKRKWQWPRRGTQTHDLVNCLPCTNQLSSVPSHSATQWLSSSIYLRPSCQGSSGSGYQAGMSDEGGFGEREARDLGGGRGWGHAPRILHALKCVRGLLRLFFVHAHSTYIPASCHLRVAALCRKVYTTYGVGALASGLGCRHVRRASAA